MSSTQHKLVIAEKPSVGRAYADVLGAKTKCNNYYEGNGYIVSWAIGHLLAPAEPDIYDSKYKKWNYNDLPIIIDKWKYVPTDSTKKQLKILLELMKRKDVSVIINSCDSGREGELIFRLIYSHCPTPKPLQRLWIASMEESAIINGFNSLRAGKDYDNLYYAALCRQRADWLVGMNFSRAFSVIYNSSLRVGRVQTPTLAMLVERNNKINNFVKEPFYVVELSGHLPKGSITAEREKLKDRSHAEAIAIKCNGKTASIDTITTKRKTVSPQALYDLTSLQREANRLFGYTASETLEIAQSLYEKRAISYPRTDSRYLTEDMLPSLPALIKATMSVIPFTVSSKVGNTNPEQVIDNAKVTDHHALVPTPSISASTTTSLSERENNIFILVCTRFISAVSEKHIYDETGVTIGCEGEIFTVKGKTVVQWGWKGIEQALATNFGKAIKGEDEPLPKMVEGMTFTAETAVREGFTSPPKHYTDDTLLSAMENASADDMPENFHPERAGLGTPATRSNIIEGLIKGCLIVRKAKNLLPTEKGCSLIAVLPDTVKSPQMTADWEHALKDIENGIYSPDEFMANMNKFVKEIVEAHPPSSVDSGIKGQLGERQSAKGMSGGSPICKCPRCGNDIVEKEKGFFCVAQGCKMGLFKDNKLFTAQKKKLTKTIATKLLKDGKALVEGFVSKKTGKPYNATVVLDVSGDDWPQFKMEFGK